MFTKYTRAGATSVTALALALSLAACGSDEPEPAATTEPTSQEATTPAAEPTTPEAETAEQDDAKSQEEALDEYVALEQAQLETQADAFADTYSEVTVAAEYPDTVVFTYTYAQQMDQAEAAAQLESMVSTLEELTRSAVFPGMEATGVVPTQKATYVYNNADGSEIWSTTVES